jgi:hypothetical protein
MYHLSIWSTYSGDLNLESEVYRSKDECKPPWQACPAMFDNAGYVLKAGLP